MFPAHLSNTDIVLRVRELVGSSSIPQRRDGATARENVSGSLNDWANRSSVSRVAG
jgi:hypothetical protein